MPRNVEIKAIVKDIDKIKKIASNLTNCPGEILRQVDTFYKVSSGRLKLRNFEYGGTSQLVYYNRPDEEGPKLSDYSICQISNPNELHEVLKASLGEIGVVKKTRHLFIYEQTRIHIDEVVGLGNFMELEVCLKPEQTLSDGQQIAKDLMVKLEIGEKDLLSGAYLDQLVNQ